ncbi:MAG: hypothetical protein ACR2O2_17365 [Ruegeria sp.]
MNDFKTKSNKSAIRAAVFGACFAVATGYAAGEVSAQTWEENLKRNAETTEQNHLNAPFVKPENFKTPYTSPGYWPIFENRGPLDFLPAD